MLQRALDTYFPYAPPRLLLKLAGYIDGVNTRRRQIAERTRRVPGVESAGVRLLRKVLADADVDYLLTRPNDYARYTEAVRPALDTLERVFDPVHGRVMMPNLFIAKHAGPPTAEFVIAVRRPNPLAQLPLDEPWEAWAKVRPLRLLDLDSPELTFHTYLDRIVFKHRPPTRAVFALDVAALVLQYANYLLSRRNVRRPLLTVPEYLHRYVLTDSLSEDLFTLWLRTRYAELLAPGAAAPTRQEAEAAQAHNNIYGQLGTQFAPALGEVVELIDLVRAGNVTPTVFVASLPLASAFTPQHYRALAAVTEVPDLRQDAWVRYLRDYRWIELVLGAQLLNRANPEYRPFANAARRDLPLALATRFWTNITDPRTRAWVEEDVRAKLEMINQV